MAGTAYYPEMGEKPDPTALLHAEFCLSRMALRWAAKDDAAVRALFASTRIRPRSISLVENIRGGTHWSAHCTFDAYDKLRAAGATTLALLLD